jgi:hypothetical protein
MRDGLTSSDRQHLALYGDSLATNVYQGLRSMAACRTEAFIISRRARRGTGLVRSDQFDWPRHVRRFTEIDCPDALVVSLGGNDRQALKARGRHLRPFTSRWWIEYDRRLCCLMRRLKTSRARLFWLGLPIVRSTRVSADFVKLNTLIRRRAADHRISHIDIWDAFADAQGRYTDFDWRRDGRRLRHIDGIHFAPLGRKQLAALVLAAIRSR